MTRPRSRVSAWTLNQADTQCKLGRPPASSQASLLPSTIMGSSLSPRLSLVSLVLGLLTGGKPGPPLPLLLPQHPSLALSGQASSTCFFRCEHDVPKPLLSGGSRNQRWLLPASQGGPGTGVRLSVWLLPIPCADSHLPVHRVLERPADPGPKDCQEGRMQRLEGSEGGRGPAEGRSRWWARSSIG